MFVKIDDDRRINLNFCRQVEIVERYGKSIIILRSGIVIQNSGIQSTFLIRGFETKDEARRCLDRIFEAFRANEKDYDLKVQVTEDVVLSVEVISDEEFENKWMNNPT